MNFSALRKLMIAALGFSFFSCRTSVTPQSELEGTIIQICPPFQTPLERNLWLALPANYIAKKLFTNYMNCKAKEVKLSAQEMIDLYAGPTWQEDSEAYSRLIRFANSVVNLKEAKESPRQSFDLFAVAGGGTLGVFTVHFNGIMKYISVAGDEPEPTPGIGQIKKIVLVGKISFSDRWDFDPKAPGERAGSSGDDTAEARTRIAHKFMSGRAFDVNSEVVSGSIETTVMDLGKKSIVGSLANFPISIEGVTPSQERFPTFSPLGMKLIEIVSKAKNENYNLGDILKILKDTCAEEKDPLVKEACPDIKNLE